MATPVHTKTTGITENRTTAVRPHQQCACLFFDGSNENAVSRLFTHAQHVWVVQGDEPNAADLLRVALAEIDSAVRHDGTHVVVAISYESSSAFNATNGLTMQPKPPVHEATPYLQALAFAPPKRLNRAQALAWLKQQSHDATTHFMPAEPLIEPTAFTHAIEEIRALIAAGDAYQVNFTFPLTAELLAHANQPDAALAAAYLQLIEHLDVAYGAFLTLPHSSILSASPELFFELTPTEITCRPMKGTAAASDNVDENKRRATALANDPKNRAENLMIVDLMRNDLSRLPQSTHVHVPELFDVQPYGTVLQMSSTVKASLHPQPSITEVFDALFPCGSITGAPKRRVMEIIHQLEPHHRGAYCGAIGFIEPAVEQNIHAVFSVPIRTLQTTAQPTYDALNGQHWPLQLSVGAGITYDSNAQDEWQESLLKARFFTQHTQPFELIETLRVEAQGVCLLNEHLARMQESMSAFNIPFNRLAIEQAIHDALPSAIDLLSHHTYSILRLGVTPDGTCNASVRAAEHLTEPVLCRIHDVPVNSNNPFLQHKTSVRARYNAALTEAKQHGWFDQIFVNEQGELTEGGRSNLFVRIDGIWYTPPTHCGLLAGIQRAIELNHLNAQERILYPSDLEKAEQIMLCNSIYGARTALLI